MTTSYKTLLIAVGAISSLAASASAQNAAHSPLDLVLTFQNPGGSQGASSLLTATVGTTNTTARVWSFRDATPGSFTSLVNIGTALTTAYGSTWYDQPTLWMAGMGQVGTSDAQTTISNGDAQRTVYFTRARDAVGTVGLAGSVGFTNPNSSFFTVTNSGINTIKNQFEQQPSLNANTTPAYQNTTSNSFIDEALNFEAGGAQAPAYGTIIGGVQDNFFSGSFGTFGSAGVVELALDLYRMQPGILGDNSPNPNVTGLTGESIFLGTLTISQAGQVGFSAAVPEPSSLLLLGSIGTIACGTFRRRKSASLRAI